MAALLKKAFNIGQSTLFVQNFKLHFVVSATCRKLYSTDTITTQDTPSQSNHFPPVTTTEYTPSQPNYSPLELLREKAFKIEQTSSLRSRCSWTKDEVEKLLDLIEKHGKRWTFVSTQFIDRSPSNVMNKYYLIKDADARGPWAKEELQALTDIGQGRSFYDIEDWASIQENLPTHRPLYMIKQTYKHTIDPNIKKGRWTADEAAQLKRLIYQYGEGEMDHIALLMGSRTKRQCLERWRWQMTAEKKGRFTKEEDDRILEAVEKYGQNFAVVAKVAGISRTPRHTSQHYHNFLAPDIDRSEWTRDEEEKVYTTCIKHGRDMLKTKQELGSKRSKRDMWNHFTRYEKLFGKNKE